MAENALDLAGSPARRSEVTLLNTVPSGGAGAPAAERRAGSRAHREPGGRGARRALAASRIYTPCRASSESCNLYGPTEDTTYTTGSAVVRGDGPRRRRRSAARSPNTQRLFLDRRRRAGARRRRGRALHRRATAWRAAISNRPELTARAFRPRPVRAPSPARACTAPATWPAGGRTGRSTSSAGSTTRSRSAASASSWARSRRRWPRTRRWREAVVLAREDARGRQAPGRLRRRRDAGRRRPASCASALAERAAGVHGARRPSSCSTPLPLTPNGKVDRKALPAPGGRCRAEGALRRPRAGRSRRRSRASSPRCSGLARSASHDDFFALGGHSLLATQAVARIRAALGVELPLRALFDAPTVAAAGRARRRRPRRRPRPAAPPLVRAPRRRPSRSPSAQERLLVPRPARPGIAAYHIPSACA